MSQFLTITQSNSLAFGERKKAIKKKTVHVGRVTLNFLLVVLICAAAVFYIFEVNNVATRGYQIRELEKEVQELKNSNENLKIREAELKSLNNIQEKTNELNMTAPKGVSYLSLPGNMAMK